MTLTLLLALLHLAEILIQFTSSYDSQELVIFSSNVVTFVTLILSMCVQFVEWKKRLITSGVNFIFAFLAFITMAIYFIRIEMTNVKRISLEIINFFLRFSLVVAFSFAERIPSESKPPERDPPERNTPESNPPAEELTPVERASFLSRITFFWMTRFMIKGWKLKLNEKEVPSLLASEQAEHLHQEFKMTQKELSHQNVKLDETETMTSSSGCSVSLKRVLIRMYWKEMMTTFAFRLLYDILIFCNPVMLKIFVTYLRGDSTERNYGVGCVYCLLFFIINVLLVILDQAVFSRGWKTGINVSTTLMAAIYDKVQKIGMQDVVILNLLSTDVSLFREMIPYLFILWSGPFQMLICFVLLFCYIGWVAAFCFLIGPVIIIFFLISKKIETIQNDYTSVKGNRIQLLREMIENIKSVKLFAQENAYLKKLKKIRDQEINHLRKRVYCESVISSLGEITPQWITLFIFLSLRYMNDMNSDTLDYIFVTLLALNILETNMSMYSDCIFDIIKTKESYKTIVKFLELEESSFKPDEEITDDTLPTLRSSLDFYNKDVPKESVSKYSVIMTYATFKGECLKNINLEIKAGQLVAVCGKNNSGKSALLYALLGQIKKEAGRVCRVGKVAYTPQEPWVFHDTIKMNVLFGKNFHERHFQQALTYCCLNEELKEDTVINENGSNLSGGQLYRINLARAVYSRPKIFLLDNPLCALDVTTASTIFDKLLGENGLLKDITRIIVTQPTAHWLKKADQIIFMDSNMIAESGTYKELMAKKGKFQRLLQECQQNKDIPTEKEKLKRHPSDLRSVDFLEQNTITNSRSKFGNRFWKSQRGATVRFKCEPDPFMKFNNTTVRIREPKSEGGVRKANNTTVRKQKQKQSFLRQISRRLYMNNRSLQITPLEVEDLSTKNSEFKVAPLVFRKYLKSLGVFSLMAMILLGILFEGFRTQSNYLYEDLRNQNGTDEHSEKDIYMIGSFSFAAGIFLILYGILSTLITTKASCKIHHSMAESIFHRPLTFFETTDQGDIMMPFTEILSDVDYDLPNAFAMWIKDLLKIMAAAVLLIMHIKILAILLVFLIVLVLIISWVFVRATSLLQDFNFKYQALLYTHFLETESGTHIIKAYNNEEIFINKAYKCIDNYQKFFWSVIAAKRWSGFLLQFLGCLIILASCLYFVYHDDNSSAEIVLTYLILTVKCFEWVVRAASDIAIKRVSLHKVEKFRNDVSNISVTEIPDWPSEGEIEFLDYSAAYPEEPQNCLNDIAICIQPREKVGIIGESGSGKSSLMLAITRLIDCVKGRINIDGINIESIDPIYLRSKLTIFPQNTNLFSASLRSNLDPEDEFSDETLTEVLSEVQLDGRDLNETCEKFSVGDKQLVGLAKCILKKTKVLILDECTANVIAPHDQHIREIIEKKFSDCTVLNIVHNLDMVQNYDKILVMDKGEVKEFDSPKNLSKNKNGFYMKLKEQESKNKQMRDSLNSLSFRC